MPFNELCLVWQVEPPADDGAGVWRGTHSLLRRKGTSSVFLRFLAALKKRGGAVQMQPPDSKAPAVGGGGSAAANKTVSNNGAIDYDGDGSLSRIPSDLTDVQDVEELAATLQFDDEAQVEDEMTSSLTSSLIVQRAGSTEDISSVAAIAAMSSSSSAALTLSPLTGRTTTAAAAAAATSVADSRDPTNLNRLWEQLKWTKTLLADGLISAPVFEEIAQRIVVRMQADR